MSVSKKTSPEIDGCNNWKPPNLMVFSAHTSSRVPFKGFLYFWVTSVALICTKSIIVHQHLNICANCYNLQTSIKGIFGGIPQQSHHHHLVASFFAEKHELIWKNNLKLVTFNPIIVLSTNVSPSTFDGNYSEIYWTTLKTTLCE